MDGGLSVAEAMMCGTPVIAFQRGAMEELIVDRKTGFLVRNVDEAVIAVSYIRSISRTLCRQHALDHFSSEVMAARYIACYEKVLSCQNKIR